MSKDSNKIRIVTAVEALVEAASMEVDSLTQHKICSNLDDLKSSYDSKLEELSQSMKVLNDNFDSKINAVEQKNSCTDEKVEALSQSMNVSNEDFDSKMNTVDNELEVLSQSMKVSNENFDSKINTLNKHKRYIDNKVENLSQSVKVSNLNFDSKINTLNQQKDSIDNKLEALSQSMKISNKDFDSRIKTINQHIISLKDKMEEVKGFLAMQEKRQKLEFAISCSTLHEFKYYSDDCQKTSSILVEKILKWFALGYGFHLPVDATVSNSSKYDDMTREELFRTKLMRQLENLIGHKPRLVDNGEDDFTVYYK